MEKQEKTEKELKEDLIFALANADRINFDKLRTYKCERQGIHFINVSSDEGKIADLLSTAYAPQVMKFYQEYGDQMLLMGPAYKGIPLAATVAMKVWQEHKISLPYCYDRKEVKDHGEGGDIVGTKIKPHHKIVIIEDVITAGTSIKGMLEVVNAYHAKIIGEVLMVDRCECMVWDEEEGEEKPQSSALETLKEDYGIKAVPVMDIYDILHTLIGKEINGEVALTVERCEEVLKYLKTYGPEKHRAKQDEIEEDIRRQRVMSIVK